MKMVSLKDKLKEIEKILGNYSVIALSVDSEKDTKEVFKEVKSYFKGQYEIMLGLYDPKEKIYHLHIRKK